MAIQLTKTTRGNKDLFTNEQVAEIIKNANNSDKIAFKPNPKRVGSQAYDRYSVYCKAKTVQEYLDLNNEDLNDLRYDLRKGFVKIGG